MIVNKKDPKIGISISDGDEPQPCGFLPEFLVLVVDAGLLAQCFFRLQLLLFHLRDDRVAITKHLEEYLIPLAMSSRQGWGVPELAFLEEIFSGEGSSVAGQPEVRLSVVGDAELGATHHALAFVKSEGKSAEVGKGALDVGVAAMHLALVHRTSLLDELDDRWNDLGKELLAFLDLAAQSLDVLLGCHKASWEGIRE